MNMRTQWWLAAAGLAWTFGCGASNPSEDSTGLAEANSARALTVVAAHDETSSARAAQPCAEPRPVEGDAQKHEAALLCPCSGTNKNLTFQTTSTATGTSTAACQATLDGRVDHWCVNQNIPADCSGTCSTGSCKPKGAATGVTSSTTATGVSCSTTTGTCSCACR